MRSARRSHLAPCIALLTDYGIRDPYVGIVKAVLLDHLPGIPLVDISHEIAPQNVEEGGYVLWASHSHFPKGTVFVCVVDPGVGTDRSLVVLQTADHLFIAPDNGILSLVASSHTEARLYEVSPAAVEKYARHPVSATFHGRDIIAPLGAALARGIPPRSLGKQISVLPPIDAFVLMSTRPSQGRVLHVDRFGNIVTNIRFDVLEGDTQPSVRLKGTRVSCWIKTFAEGDEQEPALIHGSAGLVEIVLKNGDAARRLGAAVHDSMELEWRT